MGRDWVIWAEEFLCPSDASAEAQQTMEIDMMWNGRKIMGQNHAYLDISGYYLDISDPCKTLKGRFCPSDASQMLKTRDSQ